MKDCLFCKIFREEVPSYTVYKDEATRAFLDVYPSAPGHSMVIHRNHGATILDYGEGELKELMSTVKKIAHGLETAFDTNILTIGINHGEPSGVSHLHIHLIPRYEHDGGGVIQSLITKKGEESLEEIREKVKEKMGNTAE
ncbi:MAG: HIT family protein [bacterium]|nr:HIT family protein [bacterium]